MAEEPADTLDTYRRKRDFSRSPEPTGAAIKTSAKKKNTAKLSFVVQKHAATRLHYDLRLEINGVLKSWAVTKGPSLNPADKRLAVRTEDHPLEYGSFEGVIPDGYGAGTVMLWDQGEWIPKTDAIEGLIGGSLKFELKGARLQGNWALVLMKGAKGHKGKENWLLIKERDDAADEAFDPLASWTDSIASGRDFKAIERAAHGHEAAAAMEPDTLKFPAFVEPQLATLKETPPSGAAWAHELKFDGYRIQALLSQRRVKLITRNGKDWTTRYPAVTAALAKLTVQSAAIDGELVALDSDGRSNFSALQAATDAGMDDILAYFAFDLLFLDGENLQRRPLSERKSALRKLLPKSGRIVRFSDHIADRGADVIAKACALGLEGIVSKKLSASYRSGRSAAWIKSKCVGRDEFLIGGFRKSDKKGRPFSSLLVGEFENDALIYRGRVGSGFSDASLEDLSAVMAPLKRKTTAFVKLPPDARRGAVWLAPKLVAEVAYTERTVGGLLRHPTFLGLREDKAPEQIVTRQQKETEESTGRAANDARSSILGLRISNPDRFMFDNGGPTKRDIAEYIAEFSVHILPFLKNHPVSLVRCPSGLGERCFFQKHMAGSAPPEFRATRIIQSDGTKADYILLETPKSLVAAAQMGVIELHLWGSRADRLEYPDRLVIDLDPDDGLSFMDVRNAAIEVRDILASAGLKSFALLTGGKGIHVVAPLERRRQWQDIKYAARGLARQMAAGKPELCVSEMSKKKRVGKIFIDWLRNERGATAICPYSLRARRGAPVATPLGWAELMRTNAANAFTINNIRQRIAAMKADPWKGYNEVRQSLSAQVIKVLCGKI